METGALDIIIGKGPSARVIQLELPPFTLIAATTRIALLSSPLRSRFAGGVFRLVFYTEEDVREIIRRSARVLGVHIAEDAVREIARRSRYTPRVANRLLKRCRDYAQVKGNGEITAAHAVEALSLLEVDSLGLDAGDRRLLEAIITKYNGGPVGVQTLAASTAEEMETIEEVHEPYLLQLGFLERTARGRVATARAYTHLNHPLPKEQRQLI